MPASSEANIYLPEFKVSTPREPGLANFGIGRERYIVRAQSMVLIPLFAGDEIEVVDPEGLQCAHLVAFDSNSKICTGQFKSRSRTVGTESSVLGLE